MNSIHPSEWLGDCAHFIGADGRIEARCLIFPIYCSYVPLCTDGAGGYWFGAPLPMFEIYLRSARLCAGLFVWLLRVDLDQGCLIGVPVPLGMDDPTDEKPTAQGQEARINA
jgi:hypothetical protein